MSGIGPIAISGLQAAAARLAVSAANVVNARSGAPATAAGEVLGAAYTPQRVASVAVDGGGVRVEIVPVRPATVLAADPSSPTGFSALPNVDIAAELVDQTIATASYAAAARLLSAQAELDSALLSVGA